MASITPRGDKWLAQVRIKRAGVIVFSESRTFPTRPLAASWAERLEERIERDGIPSVVHTDITLGELITRHLAYVRKLRPLVGRSAIANSEYMAGQFAAVRLSALTSAQLVEWATRRRLVDGVTPATILANLSAVSAAVHAAPHAHGVPCDPQPVADALKYLRDTGTAGRSREVVRLVSPAEEAALLDEFARRNHHHQTSIDMVMMYRLAIALPRRVSELCRLRWQDVDMHARTVKIRDVKHPIHKTGNDQVVPLLGEAWALLEQMPHIEERICPHDPHSVCAAFERTRNRIAATGMPGIKDLRFHDLRHTGITRLFQAGLQVQEVILVSGHSSWGQLKRYTHIKPDDVHRAYAGGRSPQS